jgi:hypothetical protein
MFVTGGATAPDGSRVVLRTYTDAFEWDVKDGDVVAALTTGTPRVTPLSDDPFGEAISYTPDGKLFVTVSETESLEGEEPTIFSYTPSTSAPEPVGAGEDRDKDAGPSFLDRIGLQGIMYLVSAVGALGAILVVVGVVAILRARRRPTTPGDEGADGDGPPTRSSASAPTRGRTYGGGADSRADRGYRDVEPGYERDGRAPSGRVYGAGGGAVYGGGRPAGDGRGDASGTVYGAGGGTVYGGTGGAGYGGAVYGGRAGSVYGGDYDGRGRGGDGYYHDGGYR